MRNKILKFRTWDGLNKKFSYWTMNDLCTYSEKDEKPSALDDWQQDTGLFDRNGKEIYEGDICKWPSDINREIVWDSRNACFSSRDVMLQAEIGKIAILGHHLEIIGNIYETPELLEKTPLL